jgi:hypothetical protein
LQLTLTGYPNARRTGNPQISPAVCGSGNVELTVELQQSHCSNSTSPRDGINRARFAIKHSPKTRIMRWPKTPPGEKAAALPRIDAIDLIDG